VPEFGQQIPPPDCDGAGTGQQLSWRHYWDCDALCYPDRSGDLRSVTTASDFYSARQWHSTAMYCEYIQPVGMEHEMLLCLPAGHMRTVRLILWRGPGPGFSERDRALLTLLCPHLHQAYLDAERHRNPTPQLTPGSGNCCTRSPPGTPTPRSPAARRVGRNRAHPPAKHLRQATGLQPHRRRHPRLLKPGSTLIRHFRGQQPVMATPLGSLADRGFGATAGSLGARDCPDDERAGRPPGRSGGCTP